MTATLSVFKLSVQSVRQLQQHMIEVFQNDRIALSMNFCGKSFHIDSKAVFSSAMLVGFATCSVLVAYPYTIIWWIEIWRLKYHLGYFKVRIAVQVLVPFEKCTLK